MLEDHLIDRDVLLDNFIADFPDGSKSLIHYQNSKELAQFSKQLNAALTAKMGKPGFYNTMKFGRCVEASLLQNLALLPIAISKPASAKASGFPKSTKRASLACNGNLSHPTLTTELTPYGESIKEFIERTTHFFNSTRSFSGAHLTMTAGALSHFDIEAFSTVEMTNHLIMPEEVIVNRPIANFVDSCLKRLSQAKDPEVIIRTMHSIILLSPSNDLQQYLNEGEAKHLLNSIAHITFNRASQEDRALVNQLFIIKNIYPAVFPVSLAKTIAPFVQIFQQQSHNSAFEVKIHADLRKAAAQLAKQYPGLIHPTKINYDNLISASLGLESDVAYEDGEIKVCGQVDGDKYHLYLGSGRETQRTKLRDTCFRSQAWKIVKFSDGVNGVPYATTKLKENIVIPTFEIKTAENILAVKKIAGKLTEAHSELASLTSVEAQIEKLRQLQQETIQSLESINTLGGTDKESVVSELRALERELSQLQTMMETQQHRVTLDLPKQLDDLQINLTSFDYNAAERLAAFSKQTALLQTSITAMQAAADKLLPEVQATDTLIRQHEQTLATATPIIDRNPAKLAALSAQRDQLNQQLI